MYPYPGLNNNPCYNDAPVFAEIPQIVVPAGSPVTYNPTAYDLNGDSIVYDWTQPLTDVNTPVTPYASNYNYTSPLPGTAFNPLNIAATLNPSSGQLSFLSWTTGAFVTAYKVTEFRNGLKISEIFREMQVVILSTGPNNPPELSLPFPANPDPFVDSVYFGQTVSIPVSALDTNFLNNGIDPQNVSIAVEGVMMGVNDTSSLGCPSPPCAYMNMATPISGITFAAGLFTWETSLNHLIFGGLLNPAVDYYFIIKAYDDFCPIPSYTMAPVKIVVMDYVLNAPVLDSFQINPANGHVTIYWTPISDDSTNSFDNYYIYFKTNSKSNWQLIDSVGDITQSTYTHTGVNGLTQTFFYAIQTRSGHSHIFNSGNSNILTNATTGIENTENGDPELFYNSQTGSIVLSGQCQGKIRLSIVNPLGQTVFEKSVGCNGPQQQLYKPAKSGVYLYRMLINDKEIAGKIVIP